MSYKSGRHLCETSYHSNKCNWNFEKYVTVHKEQHNILQSLEEYGHKGIYDQSKVIYLNNVIKNNKLGTINATTIYSDDYSGDFDECVTLYKDFINNLDGQLQLKVEYANSNGFIGGGKCADGKTTREVTNRYYTK